MTLFLLATPLLAADLLATAPSGPLGAVAEGGLAAMTIRSAGIAATGDVHFGVGGLGVLLILALLGAGPGSPAGGVKLTNVILLGVALLHRCRPTAVLGPPKRALKAAAAVCLIPLLVVAATWPLLLWIEPVTPRTALFEAVSAATATGLPQSVGSQLTPPGKAVIIAAMILGRIGPVLLLAWSVPRCTAACGPPWRGPLPGP